MEHKVSTLWSTQKYSEASIVTVLFYRIRKGRLGGPAMGLGYGRAGAQTQFQSAILQQSVDTQIVCN